MCNRFDFLAVLWRVLLHDLAVRTIGECVWHDLVLQFVLAWLAVFTGLNLHTSKLKRCPAIFWWVGQLVVLHHVEDVSGFDAKLFGSVINDLFFFWADACHLAGSTLTALGHQDVLSHIAFGLLLLRQQIVFSRPCAIVELRLNSSRIKHNDLFGIGRDLVDHTVIALGLQVSSELISSSTATGFHAGFVFGCCVVWLLEACVQWHDVFASFTSALFLHGIKLGHVSAVGQVYACAQPAAVFAVWMVDIKCCDVVCCSVIQQHRRTLIVLEY